AVVARGGGGGGGLAGRVGGRGGRVGQQLGGGERAPLGLEGAALLDGAALADAAVCGHQDRVRVGVRRARALAQRAGEEGVEGGVGRGVGLGGLRQVHAEAADHGLD